MTNELINSLDLERGGLLLPGKREKRKKIKATLLQLKKKKLMWERSARLPQIK